jgi:hypothetical protein
LVSLVVFPTGQLRTAIVWRPRRERMQVRAVLASPVHF